MKPIEEKTAEQSVACKEKKKWTEKITFFGCLKFVSGMVNIFNFIEKHWAHFLSFITGFGSD
ncbi:hypothetical protein [Pseudomonas mandelii]|uniref:hypothetical protein n=1 Tax=Pseudomonas mandelii TaxID=75612 RepID=UPI003C71734A